MSEDRSHDILARLQERLLALDRERERILTAIQVITGEPDSSSATNMNGDVPVAQTGGTTIGSITTTPPGPAGSRRVEIRPDSYFGMSHHQAARKYLVGLGHADKLENILKAITMGGVEVGGANPLLTLRATLTKNTLFFVRVGPNTFGLREFYPHLQDNGKPNKLVLRRRKVTPKTRVVRHIARRRRPKMSDEKAKKESAPPHSAPATGE